MRKITTDEFPATFPRSPVCITPVWLRNPRTTEHCTGSTDKFLDFPVSISGREKRFLWRRSSLLEWESSLSTRQETMEIRSPEKKWNENAHNVSTTSLVASRFCPTEIRDDISSKHRQFVTHVRNAYHTLATWTSSKSDRSKTSQRTHDIASSWPTEAATIFHAKKDLSYLW